MKNCLYLLHTVTSGYGAILAIPVNSVIADIRDNGRTLPLLVFYNKGLFTHKSDILDKFGNICPLRHDNI
jgi:hypothetical protein